MHIFLVFFLSFSSFAQEEQILKTKTPEEKVFLNSQQAKPLELHNKALSLLSTNKPLALALFQTNFYQNFFYPSYKALNFLKHPPSVKPVVWHGFMMLWTLLCLISLFFLIKNLNQGREILKMVFVLFSGLTLLISSGFFILKPRGVNLKELDLLAAPFVEALEKDKIKAGSDLLLRKFQGNWVQVETFQNKRGWVPKSKLLITVE